MQSITYRNNIINVGESYKDPILDIIEKFEKHNELNIIKEINGIKCFTFGTGMIADVVDLNITKILITNNLCADVLELHNNLFSCNDWGIISSNQALPESFIIKYKNKLHWKKISKYQDLSIEFIKENIEHLDFSLLIKNKKLKDDVRCWIKNFSIIK